MKTPIIYPLLPSDQIKELEDYIIKFLSDDYSILCKTSHTLIKSGLLLYGAPGIGKSNYVNYLINHCIFQKKACVFNIDTYGKLFEIIPKVEELRQIQDNLFIIILEEMDELFLREGAESRLKNFMDGIHSIDNLLFIGTTNYIDKIPKSLIERPSRFKKVLEIKPTDNIEDLKVWLTKTYKGFIPNLSDKECEDLHDKCINKPIDEIKHIIIDYKIGISNNFKNAPKIGFKK